MRIMKKIYIVLFLILFINSCSYFAIQKENNKDLKKTANELNQKFEKRKQAYPGVSINSNAKKPRAIDDDIDSVWLNKKINIKVKDLYFHTALENILSKYANIKYEFSFYEQSEEQAHNIIDEKSNSDNNVGGQTFFAHEEQKKLTPIKISISGNMSIRSFIDKVSAKADLIYVIDNNNIVFKDTVIRNFSLNAIPGIASNDFNLPTVTSSSNDNSNNNNSSGQNNSSFKVNTDFYSDVDAMLNRVKVYMPHFESVVSKSAGVVTLSGRPSNVKAAKVLLDNFSSHLNKAVLVDINLLSQEYNSQTDIGLGVNGIYDVVGGIKGLVATASAGLANQTNQNSIIVNDTRANVSTSGSNLIANALVQRGASRVVNKPTVLLPNNQVVTVSANNIIHYLSKITRSTNTNIDSLSTGYEVETGSLYGGTQMALIASINDNNQISLRVKYQLNSNIQFTNYTIGDNSISLPQFTNQVMEIPLVNISSGQTIAVVGLFDVSSSGDKTLNPVLPIIGDSRKSNDSRREIIMLITANIL